MKIYFHKNFDKKFSKLNSKIKKIFISRLKIFSKNQFDQKLNNHALKGGLSGFRSINITGDIRAIYKIVDEDSVEFGTIDRHSNLYK